MSVAAELRAHGIDPNGANTREQPTAVLEEARVDLVQLIRDGIPERETVPGCGGWLYRGKRYLVHAGAGVGKSIALLVVALKIVENGGTVAIIDVENGSDEYARRLECLLADRGDLADACQQRLRYYDYPRLSLQWSNSDWVAAVIDADLVLFDSSRVTLSSVGLSEDSNDDYATFMNALVVPLSQAGITTTILDNEGHEGGKARGASSKDQLNEVVYELQVSEEFDEHRQGELAWIRKRQRFSGLPQKMVQRLGDGTYEPPQASEEELTEFRPTVKMEQASKAVEREPKLGFNQILSRVGGNRRALHDAVGLLVEEGFFSVESGSRRAVLHSSLRPYRQADDQGSDVFAGSRTTTGSTGSDWFSTGSGNHSEEPQRLVPGVSGTKYHSPEPEPVAASEEPLTGSGLMTGSQTSSTSPSDAVVERKDCPDKFLFGSRWINPSEPNVEWQLVRRRDSWLDFITDDGRKTTRAVVELLRWQLVGGNQTTESKED